MKTPSWTELGLVLTSSTSRAIYTLPIAGYVILYSDYFQSLFKFHSLNESWGFLSFTTRINCIYYGSIILLAAFGIWRMSSPPLLRGKRDLQQFVSDIVVARDRSTVIGVAKSEPFTLEMKEVRSALSDADLLAFPDEVLYLKTRGPHLGDGAGEYEHRIPTALAYYFKWHNAKFPWLRMFITAAALVGYMLVVVLPSLDLFARVLGSQYHHLTH